MSWWTNLIKCLAANKAVKNPSRDRRKSDKQAKRKFRHGIKLSERRQWEKDQ